MVRVRPNFCGLFSGRQSELAFDATHAEGVIFERSWVDECDDCGAYRWIVPAWTLVGMAMAAIQYGLSVGLVIVGMGAWNLVKSRSTVQQEILGREQQLTQLEQELSEKQHHIGQLEGRLSEVQHRWNQSGSLVEELQMAQHTAISQLDKYQDEVQATRQRIEGLQAELHDLRQHAPSTPAGQFLEDFTVDDHELIQECEAFQIVTRDQAVLRLFII